MPAVRSAVDDKLVRCMFSKDMAELRLELRHSSHRYALYSIARNWRQLPVHRLSIRGDVDFIAALKLESLFSSTSFYCEEVCFTCVTFIDGESVIPCLKSAFLKCKQMQFNLCSFDRECLHQLLELIANSSLRSFRFVSNFIDDFPTSVLQAAILQAPNLRELDIAGAGLGWDHRNLISILRAVSKSEITHLGLSDNDITSIRLPNLPKIKHLDLNSNPLRLVGNETLLTENLPNCTSLAITTY
ncbi:hypothetical protein L0F63_002976 [Massospora cicadina]|nr:hypothetical protein L0F63_002976 [Massospora cicadina]